MIFTFIDQLFRRVFDAICNEAITFLIAIFCYSISSFFVYFINSSNESSRRLILKIFYTLFIVIIAFFTIWRLGFIVMLDYIDAEFSFSTFTIFFINIVYILFALILFVSFYKKIPWLKNAIIILLWAMFLLLTFIICPAMEYGQSSVFTTLSSDTLFQVLIVATIFIVPRGLNKFKKVKESGVD
ncbi:MAG: hypothetical protein ACTSRI_02695 [Promethearchaeota archaeon]